MRSGSRSTLVAHLVAGAIVAAGLVAPGPTVAQDTGNTPGAVERSTARRLFEEGLAAAREDDWAAARVAWKRSYAIVPAPRTLLNLAAAQVETGHVVEALESYRRFLREASAADQAQFEQAIRGRIAELAPQVAYLNLRAPGLPANARVHIDETLVRHAVLSTEVPVDPGMHEVRIEAPGMRRWASSLTVAPGEHAEVRWEPEAIARAGAAEAGEEDPAPTSVASPAEAARAAQSFEEPAADARFDEATHRRRRRALWVSAAVLVVAGVALAVGLSLRPDGFVGPGREGGEMR